MLGRDFFVETADGRMLRAMSRGEGDDLVVLEAGLGASGLSWGPVHDAIAGSAHVVAYERAAPALRRHAASSAGTGAVGGHRREHDRRRGPRVR